MSRVRRGRSVAHEAPQQVTEVELRHGRREQVDERADAAAEDARKDAVGHSRCKLVEAVQDLAHFGLGWVGGW